jgi:16S rRNA (guanine527-N7)-methyltransferase
MHPEDIWHPSIWQESLHWIPSPQQLQHFQNLYHQVIEGNKTQNLTRITTLPDFFEKHLWDSLRGIASITSLSDPEKKIRCLDIGTGAGFPALPIAIACPEWHMTALDSHRRKIAFVGSTVTQLGLKNVSTQAERAEILAQDPKHRNHYNLVLIRAVAKASICAEYSLPFLTLGGSAILFRGQWTKSEETELHQILSILGGELQHIDAFQTPLTQSQRHCLIVKKRSPTPPQFPRAPGIPEKYPLP